MSEARRGWVKWGLAGLLLVGLHLALAALSHRFVYGSPMADRPIGVLVGLLMTAGLVYLLVVWSVRSRELRDPTTHRTALLLWVVVVGTALRMSFLTSTPMLEDDYYRYLWDGAVIAHGVNPYSYAPSQALTGEGSDSTPPVLRQLAADSGLVARRVNHPDVRTIYPPVAQAAFALGHRLRPWSLVAWRLVVFGLDLVVLALLAVILKELRLPLIWVVIYWWNPLVIKELFNSAHMDVVAMPLVLAGVLLALREKSLWSAGILALAVGAKLWPAVLLPLVLRRLLRRPKELVTALGVFGVVAGALLLPVYLAGLDRSSGFVRYGRGWEMNDALFMLILWGSRFILGRLHLGHLSAQFVTRVAVAAACALWIAWLVRRPTADGRELCRRCLLVVAAVFLLSPTQFPWYYVWVLPFLVLRPRLSLLLLTALLPLYYLRFYLKARGAVDAFDYGVVWVEYAPVWCLLAAEWLLGWNPYSQPGEEETS